MGAETLIALGGSVLGSATDIYFNYNKKKESESSLNVNSAFKIAELNQNVSSKNSNSLNKIYDLRFQNMNASDIFSKTLRKTDMEDTLKLNSVKAKYATSGVELKHTALDYINAIEDSVNNERSLRLSINANEVATRERMMTTLFADIDRNNILKDYETTKINYNKESALEKLDDRFFESTISSFLSFGTKTSKML